MAKSCLWLITLSLLAAGSVRAAEVIGVAANRKSIAVNHEALGKWAVEDRVCVLQANVDVVCGSVTKTTSKGAIVQLDVAFDNVALGDLVRKAGAARLLSSQSVDSIETGGKNPKRFDLTAGLSTGAALNFILPVLHFQVALSQSFALGLEGIFLKNTSSLIDFQTFGGFLTVNYYGSSYFRGFWAQAGAGLNFLSSTTSTGGSASAQALSFLGTAGYRARWGPGLNVGVAGGVLFIDEPAAIVSTGIVPTFTGLHPILLVDFGINF